MFSLLLEVVKMRFFLKAKAAVWLGLCLLSAVTGHSRTWAQTFEPEASARQALSLELAAPVLAPSQAFFEYLLKESLTLHPQVRSAQAQSQGARLDVDVAKWAYWPTLTINAQRTDLPGTTAAGGSNFAVQQPLWSGGALSARLDAASKLDQAGAVQVDVVRGEVGLRLVDAWAGLLDAEASRAVTARTLEGLSRYETIMQRRVTVGLSSAVELRLLSVRVSRAKTDLADAQASIQVALQRLKDIAGGSENALAPELKTPIAPPLMSAWVQRQPVSLPADFLARHPAVRKAELDAAATADQIAVQKAQTWPKLVLSYQRRLGGLPTDAQRSLWALDLNYTPGAGLASATLLDAEAARLEARLASIDALRQEKQEQVQLDWSTLKREVDRQPSLLATINSASDVLASFERLYFGGLRSWLEVLNALQELSQAELRLAQAGNATTLAYYRWRLRAGQLPTDSDWTQ